MFKKLCYYLQAQTLRGKNSYQGLLALQLAIKTR